MRISLIIILSLIASAATGQQTPVLTLGTFHFSFRSLDVVKIEDSDMIDVLNPVYQAEIKDIVNRIAEFKPTIIAIERDPANQSEIDSLYRAYVDGKYSLQRDEIDQIGFRLAKKEHIEKLICVNDWGSIPDEINAVLQSEDDPDRESFFNTFYNSPDSALFFDMNTIYKTEGILEDLRIRNSQEYLTKDLGNYLISVFKYSTDSSEFFGVDFTTGWWFNRNLRIFRNIQRIEAGPDDRILVIFGSGHMNLLNLFFDASPEYDLFDVNEYL